MHLVRKYRSRKTGKPRCYIFLRIRPYRGQCRDYPLGRLDTGTPARLVEKWLAGADEVPLFVRQGLSHPLLRLDPRRQLQDLLTAMQENRFWNSMANGNHLIPITARYPGLRHKWHRSRTILDKATSTMDLTKK